MRRHILWTAPNIKCKKRNWYSVRCGKRQDNHHTISTQPHGTQEKSKINHTNNLPDVRCYTLPPGGSGKPQVNKIAQKVDGRNGIVP